MLDCVYVCLFLHKQMVNSHSQLITSTPVYMLSQDVLLAINYCHIDAIMVQ